MIGTSTSYAGRQLDIELLQHVAAPYSQRVFPAIDHDIEEVSSILEKELGRRPTNQEIRDYASSHRDKYGSVGPKICSGMEKVVQRYAKLLLTDLGSVMFDQELGNDLISSIRLGKVYSTAWMTQLFNEANRNALNAMIMDDNDTDEFGTPPDDERIESAELVDLEIDQSSATVRIHVRISTVAGEEYEYVVPVASGVS